MDDDEDRIDVPEPSIPPPVMAEFMRQLDEYEDNLVASLIAKIKGESKSEEGQAE